MAGKNSKKRKKSRLMEILSDVEKIYLEACDYIESKQGVHDALAYNSWITSKKEEIRAKMQENYKLNNDGNSPYWRGFKMALGNEKTSLIKLYDEIFWIDALEEKICARNNKLPKRNKKFKKMPSSQKDFLCFRVLDHKDAREDAEEILEENAILDCIRGSCSVEDFDISVQGAIDALPIIGFYNSGARGLARKKIFEIVERINYNGDFDEKRAYSIGLFHTLDFFQCAHLYHNSVRLIQKNRKK